MTTSGLLHSIILNQALDKLHEMPFISNALSFSTPARRQKRLGGPAWHPIINRATVSESSEHQCRYQRRQKHEPASGNHRQFPHCLRASSGIVNQLICQRYAGGQIDGYQKVAGAVLAHLPPDTIRWTFVALAPKSNRTANLMSFTWIPLYSEIAHKVLEFESRQGELLSLLEQLKADGLKVIALTDRDASGEETPLAEIDPFTFFASFNRPGTVERRQAILAEIKEAWQLTAPIPDDFDGIPIADARNSWAFDFLGDRTPNDIPTLWRAAREAVETNWRTFDRKLFDEVLSIRQMGLSKLSMSLFWLNPRGFLSFDKHTRGYFKKREIVCEGKTAAGYFSWLEMAVASAGEDFLQVSLDAYLGDLPVVKNGPRFWWLNANPKIWDFRSVPVGSVETYTSRNEAGNKRQKYKHFAAVRPGDLVIGYITNPDKEIVAVCEITKGLQDTPDGEAIEFRKIEEFKVPVTWAELRSVPALAHCEPLISNQGSLFAVTADEYDTIRAIIDERNLGPQPPKCPAFTKADALDGLFMKESRLDEILARLRRKKAIILQGPPGVGKTFIARRLAFALMGERDDRRVTMVQFHPSYGYEDFVQGYRPTRSGLERRDGVFYQFARLARNDPKRDWFFIIDEINRGNLAKIFGELLMLIEADKRGPNHAIPLTYSEQADETFHLPSNLHFIGTMNTADRSLAMVDYALRRRFAFVTLNPEFDSPDFDAWLTGRGATAALIVRIRDRIGVLNEVIERERDLGPGFRVGHSFFCPPADHLPDDAWYREVIEGEIQPLLEEYFDSRERVDKLVSELLA